MATDEYKVVVVTTDGRTYSERFYNKQLAMAWMSKQPKTVFSGLWQKYTHQDDSTFKLSNLVCS